MDRWDNLISFILFSMLLPLGIFFYLVQFTKIIPKLRKIRGKRFWDTVPGTHQWNLTKEYKRLCSEDNESLIWYEIQKWNLFITICLLFVLGLIFFEPLIMGQH